MTEPSPAPDDSAATKQRQDSAVLVEQMQAAQSSAYANLQRCVALNIQVQEAQGEAVTLRALVAELEAQVAHLTTAATAPDVDAEP